MKVTLGTIVYLVIGLTSAPAFAHHAFAVEFDAKNCSDIKGILTKVSYENPHAYIFVDAKNAAGEVVPSTFQKFGPTAALRGRLPSVPAAGCANAARLK